jgi:succinate dehydrogenase / fumarate reductase membrane anchor subunit
MAQNYGSKRVVVGAHYGLRDWLSQRITACLMAVFTIVLLLQVLFPAYARLPNGEPLKDAAGKAVMLTGYDKWAGIFAPQWMKFLTFVVIVSLAWHAWVGMRDVWMDYVKSVGARLALQVLTIVWLVGCAGWAVQVLWRL